jgi:hypothetical protein
VVKRLQVIKNNADKAIKTRMIHYERRQQSQNETRCGELLLFKLTEDKS